MGKLVKRFAQHIRVGAGRTGASSSFFRGSTQFTGRNLGDQSTSPVVDPGDQPKTRRTRTTGPAKTVLG